MAVDLVVVRVQEVVDGTITDEIEIAAVLQEVQDLETALGLAMYRMDLNDMNVDSDTWPDGVETNAGELDFQAEMGIRMLWKKYNLETQRVLEQRAFKMIERRMEAATPTLPDPPKPSEAIKG